MVQRLLDQHSSAILSPPDRSDLVEILQVAAVRLKLKVPPLATSSADKLHWAHIPLLALARAHKAFPELDEQNLEQCIADLTLALEGQHRRCHPGHLCFLGPGDPTDVFDVWKLVMATEAQ